MMIDLSIDRWTEYKGWGADEFAQFEDVDCKRFS